jgi:ribosomal protein S18 acetylase RimI-like enzyme
MDEPMVRAVDRREAARATSVQMMAFSADPVMRWLWPEPDAYVQHFPTFVRGFGGRAFAHDAAHVTADFMGGSLWLPPSVGTDDETLQKLFDETLPEAKRSAILAMLDIFETVHPKEPHWHLCFLGVDPTRQCQGLGAALLRHALAPIDAQHQYAYLESSNPANIALYQRHGFEVVREVRVGGSPPAIPMVRAPR